jgi:NhaA family Na+:H+ antiporter
MALAVFVDLAAIIVIAIFYTSNLSFLFLGLAFVCVGILVVFNVKKVNHLFFYSILGIALWFCLMKSGVHPTLAGGILAFLVPLHSAETLQKSPADRLKHKLHSWVTFGVLPLFAFANAGISFLTISPADLEIPVILGIFCGLFFGKQIGILGFCWLSVKYRLAELPENMRWRDIYAIAILCGIGFTISLFIGTLAFGDYSTHLDSVKIGVILGSLLSGVMGCVLLLRK